MADILVSRIEPPRIARNKRIYSGNVSFNTPSAIGNITDIHIEYGRLTNLSVKNVVVYFAKQFTETPTGWIKVYRMREVMTGKWKQQDVLYYHADEVFKNEYGFGLVIDDKESLTGVVVEYFFI